MTVLSVLYCTIEILYCTMKYCIVLQYSTVQLSTLYLILSYAPKLSFRVTKLLYIVSPGLFTNSIQTIFCWNIPFLHLCPNWVCDIPNYCTTFVMDYLQTALRYFSALRRSLPIFDKLYFCSTLQLSLIVWFPARLDITSHRIMTRMTGMG